jgi:ParE toxin of type II toxin-antitoxin system, parDE
VTTHSFHSDAADELEEAAVFYESGVAGLGKSFLDEVHRTVSLIERYPDAGAAIERNLRRVRLDRFPYAVVYRRADDAVVIIALAHQRRRPGYWRGRK